MRIQEILRALATQLDAEERNKTPENPQKLKQDSVMVPPLQQGLEIEKAMVGKKSEVIDQLTRSELPDGEMQPAVDSDSTKLIADLLRFAGLKSQQEEKPVENPSSDLGIDNPAAVIVIPGNKSSS